MIEEKEKVKISQLDGDIDSFQRRARDFASTLKGFIGSNFIGMPYAFSQSGLYLGVLVLPVVVLFTGFGCLQLLAVKKEIIKRRQFKRRRKGDVQHDHSWHENEQNSLLLSSAASESESESELFAFDETNETNYVDQYNDADRYDDLRTFGGVATALWGAWGRRATNFFLAVTQLGFCVGYFIFMSASLLTLTGSVVPDWAAMLILAFASWLLTLIKDVRQLGYINVVADVLLFVSIVAAFALDNLASRNDVLAFNLKGLPLFLGTTISSFEGIGTCIPVESSMTARPGRYKRYLIATLFLTMVLLGTFGSLGYLSYGSATQGSITLNFPRDGAITQTIIGLMIAAVLATLPLQLMPVTEIAEQLCWHSPSQLEHIVTDRAISDVRLVTAQRNALRLALITGCALVAFYVPDFGPFSALVGSFGSAFLAFVIPALADFQLCVHTMSAWRILKNAAILGFAVVAIITGTYSSILQIVQDLS